MKILDLFCGAGGAAMGMIRAGHDVIGVDIKSQPRYVGKFLQGDAFSVDPTNFDFIWASPPCQKYSRLSHLAAHQEKLIPDVRRFCRESGKPYVIENVEGSPLINPVMLCGAMFGRQTYRHRLFESNRRFEAPIHPKHEIPASAAGHWRPETFISVAGHCAPMYKARQVMDIDWMTREELAESIPPYFSQFILTQIGY